MGVELLHGIGRDEEEGSAYMMIYSAIVLRVEPAKARGVLCLVAWDAVGGLLADDVQRVALPSE